MLKKIVLNKFLFLAVLLIVPMMLSAAGTRESEKSKAVTLDENVMTLLSQVESGELTLDEAKAEFTALEKEYQITVQERTQVQKMMKEIASGELKAEDCRNQVKDQLKTCERIQDKTRIKTQSGAASTNASTDTSIGGKGKKKGKE